MPASPWHAWQGGKHEGWQPERPSGATQRAVAGGVEIEAVERAAPALDQDQAAADVQFEGAKADTGVGREAPSEVSERGGLVDRAAAWNLDAAAEGGTAGIPEARRASVVESGNKMAKIIGTKCRYTGTATSIIAVGHVGAIRAESGFEMVRIIGRMCRYTEA